MQRLNRKKNVSFSQQGTIHPITILAILADVYVQVKLLHSYKFVGDNFYGLPDSLGFDKILWIFCLNGWIRIAFYI